jgi:putative ABC transport system substrate-binding protein
VSRRSCLAAFAALPLLALGSPGAAIAAGKKRLAFFSGSNREEFLADHAADRAKVLAEAGWREGINLEILWYFTEGDESRVPALVKEIVAEKPDVIWVAGNRRTRALQQATRTIPIFTGGVTDPVREGFAQSLARPGGNITGLSLGVLEMHLKMFELLRRVLPRLQAVAFIVPAFMVDYFSKSSAAEGSLKSLLDKARIESKAHGIESVEDLRSALRTLPKGGRGAAFLWPPGKLDPRAVALATVEARVPAIAEDPYLVEMGVLMCYQLSHQDDETRRTVAILDKLLRGANPATIPFELPTRSHLAINRRTAAAIGVSFPADLVLRADRVFD